MTHAQHYFLHLRNLQSPLRGIYLTILRVNPIQTLGIGADKPILDIVFDLHAMLQSVQRSQTSTRNLPTPFQKKPKHFANKKQNKRPGVFINAFVYFIFIV